MTRGDKYSYFRASLRRSRARDLAAKRGDRSSFNGQFPAEFSRCAARRDRGVIRARYRSRCGLCALFFFSFQKFEIRARETRPDTAHTFYWYDTSRRRSCRLQSRNRVEAESCAKEFAPRFESTIISRGLRGVRGEKRNGSSFSRSERGRAISSAATAESLRIFRYSSARATRSSRKLDRRLVSTLPWERSCRRAVYRSEKRQQR